MQLIDDPTVYGVVLVGEEGCIFRAHLTVCLRFIQRCWHDAEDIPATPEQIAADPLMRPLQHGEVGVSWFSRGPDLATREILSESQLTLLDRMYQPGDLLKRSIDDVRSGIVTR